MVYEVKDVVMELAEMSARCVDTQCFSLGDGIPA